MIYQKHKTANNVFVIENKATTRQETGVLQHECKVSHV